jgi:hypothetical protein
MRLEVMKASGAFRGFVETSRKRVHGRCEKPRKIWILERLFSEGAAFLTGRSACGADA